MGTASYMSPEQARGLEVDARTDVWSLGVVLYEMVAGRRPFSGPTPNDLIVSILDREPPPLALHAPDVPAELERIVMKTLAKHCEERYQAVKEMALDLRQLSRRLEVEAEIGSSTPSALNTGGATSGGSSGRRAAAETDVRAASRVSEAGAGRATSSVEYFVSAITIHKRGAALVGVALVLLLSGVSYGLYQFLSRPGQAAVPFQRTKVTRLTSTGKAKLAAVSPDGKYVAYTEDDNKRQSLWVKQVATGSTVQLVPPEDVVRYTGLTFSNDGNYVYYVNYDNPSAVPVLYRVPSLGGVSKKVLERVYSAVTFSPDGQQFAFLRDYDDRKESALILANADGSGERTLVTNNEPYGLVYTDVAQRPAWSPDGKTIAFVVRKGTSGEVNQNLVAVRVADGVQELLTPQNWSWVTEIAWQSDGNGLVFLATDPEASRFDISTKHLWHLPYPDGSVRRITNDLNGYFTFSLTAESSALVTVQTNRVTNIWVAPTTDLSRARQITVGTLDGPRGLAWTPDGRIVFCSNASGKLDIWLMDADGSNRRQLTHEGLANIRPVVSADGRYIVFVSERGDRVNVWRMDVDGGNPKQLTDGMRNQNPDLSPDGRWVVYQSIDSGASSIWKVPIEGGAAVRLTDVNSNLPVVSPDGRQVACYYWGDHLLSNGVMIFPIAGGQPTKHLNMAVNSDAFVLRWTPDGRALLNVDRPLLNVWRQPVDGGKPAQLTNFQGDQIFNFAYSPDGKWLALARGRVTDDVMLISDAK
jgi:Tol biopolymer transport system component